MRSTKRLHALITTLVAGVCLASLGAGFGILLTEPAPRPIVLDEVTTGTPPCTEEDSPGPCYWDAGTRDNGQGRSFVVLDDQTVVYFDEIQLVTK